MIQFKVCRWKNFLSTGNEYIDLNLEKSPTTLIVGPNGSGKSTLLDALSFGLFGRAHRDINKAQLVNSINKKNTVVEVEFEVGGTHFKVHRGIKPNKFEIYKNNKLISVEKSKEKGLFESKKDKEYAEKILKKVKKKAN